MPEQHNRRKNSIISLDTLKSKIVFWGTVATAIMAIGSLLFLTCGAVASGANTYIDDRATEIYNQRIEPVYRMATEATYILREQTSPEIRARALERMKEDSAKFEYQNSILGRR
jgi:hypothetical protein